MTSLIKLPNDHFAVQVPEGKECQMTTAGLMVFTDSKPIATARRIPIPPGSYTIVGMIDKITEEQAGEIVGYCKGYGFRDYEAEGYNGGSSPFDVWSAYHFNTALESFRSLLTSLSLDKNVLIIKQNK